MRTINYGIVLRLKVNINQETLLSQNVGNYRWVYNQALSTQKLNYEQYGKFMSYSELANQLPILKRTPEFEFLKRSDSTSLQQSLKDLDSAFRNFFQSKNGSRKGNIMGFPKFKSKNRSRKSFRIVNSNDNIRIQETMTDRWQIKLGKLGFFSVYNWRERLSLVYGVKINNATIYKDSDSNWYVSLSVESESQTHDIKLESTLGIDLGLKELAILSNGYSVGPLNITKKYEDRLACLQKKQAKMVKFSNNWNKINKKISKIHFKIKMTRKNYHHELSKYIVTNYDVITMETLDIQNMLKTNNSGMAKKTADHAWYMLKTFIKYKCEWFGKKLISVSKWFPSSKLCSTCGQEVQLDLSIRDWQCPRCYSIHNRDLNASLNLELISKYFVNNNIEITEKSDFLKYCFV